MSETEWSKTMSESKTKKVKEIFSDYETKTNIKEAYVTALNVMKKTNTLGIVLNAHKQKINELCRRHLYNQKEGIIYEYRYNKNRDIC